MSSSTRLHTPAVATVAAERVSVSGPVSADPSGALAACVSEFLRTWSGALDAIRPSEGVVEQLEGMTDAGVVRVLDQLGAVQQVVEVLTARVMGSVGLRSNGHEHTGRAERRRHLDGLGERTEDSADDGSATRRGAARRSLQAAPIRSFGSRNARSANAAERQYGATPGAVTNRTYRQHP